jgi:preprotein translocase subunit SecE
MKDMMQFFSEVRLELSRVIWPKFDEFIGSTIIVLVIVAAFAVYLGGVDFGLSYLAKYIFERYSI